MSKSENISSRPSPFLVVLATIGGLCIIGMAIFFLSIFFITSSFLSTGISHYKKGPKIGVLTLKGEIIEAGSILKDIRDFEDNKDIKAVVFRIDSPGGAVGAAQEIYQAIKELNSQKPVVVSMENVAASGAYYASLGASEIVADPGTLTGSIGVIVKIPDIGPLLKKIGVSQTVIKSGALKDTGDFTRPPTKEERALLKSVIEDVYNVFVEDVSKSRHIPVDQVRTLADGRVFTGRQALKAHLIDKLGNFYTAVNIAAKLAGIKGKPVLVYPKKNKLNELKKLLEQGESSGINRIMYHLFYLGNIPGLAFLPAQS